MSVMQKISGYFKQLAGEVSGNQAMHDEGRREAADAGYQEKNEQVVPVEPRTVAGAESVVSAETGREKVIAADAVPQFDFSQEAAAPPRDAAVGVTDYSDTEQLKLYRLVPIASSTDTNWDIAPNQGEVVVRARSSGDARVVAAEAELDYMEIDALPGDGNSTTSSSAFRNEKLYTVIDETDPSYPLDGPREVVAGTVRVDNIRPTEL
ncbi:hypothetical protein [Shinella sp.]|uniref:hypothetical protein n=1 Tax=Shinella sp. TaxID=1870904 RepID=UPI0029BED74D|nr:hypothetical protein [Shinella sp.]MDX3977212.1 hypothetical protein [Shinella sp.]